MSLEREYLEIKYINPNALFERWILSWIAEDNQEGITKCKLLEALESVRRYPLPLQNGQECAILRGFNKRLCQMIDEKLQSHLCLKNVSFENTDEKKPNKELGVLGKQIQNNENIEQSIIVEQQETILSPGTFRISLLVDKQETIGNHKQMKDETCNFLNLHNIPYEIRHLAVGDFMWMAFDTNGNELVLPYIIERKRMDDLSKSIRDGRFQEQKHRLLQSGFQNVIYLIENFNENRLGLPMDTLKHAIINTHIHSKFTIVHTQNHTETLLYLARITTLLTKLFENKKLIGTSKNELRPCILNDPLVPLLRFDSIIKESSTNSQLTVREVFVQQLLQIHSLSIEKALAIVNVYPTPRTLIDAYESCSCEEEKLKLLANISQSNLQNVGEKVSEAVYKFYKMEY